MLPESMAPPLANYDEFKAFMEEKGLKARRMYEPSWEDPETGKIYEAYWQVYVEKCERREDDKFYCYCLTVRDDEIARDWREAWQSSVNLVVMGWKAYTDGLDAVGKSPA